jgi:hypothetical protein
VISCWPSAIPSASDRPSPWGSSAPRAGATWGSLITRTSSRPMPPSIQATQEGPWWISRETWSGINTAIISRTGGYQGIGFAIPTNIVKAVMDAIVKHGRMIRGWLGVSVQEVTPQIAAEFGLKKPGGALIVEVSPRSPAPRRGYAGGTSSYAMEMRR